MLNVTKTFQAFALNCSSFFNDSVLLRVRKVTNCTKLSVATQERQSRLTVHSDQKVCGLHLKVRRFITVTAEQLAQSTDLPKGLEIIPQTLKVDVTEDTLVTVPSGALVLSAYCTNEMALTLHETNADGSPGDDVLEAGESVSRGQIVVPNHLPFHPSHTIKFPAGARGTVSYLAVSDIGDITQAQVNE